MRTRPHVPGLHGPWWPALALLVLALPWRVFGAIYYVATTGSNSNSCAQAQSLATPKRTIGGGAGGLACASQELRRGRNLLPRRLRPRH